MIEERINVKGTVGLDTVKIYPITQEKIVVPTKEIQEILPDEKYDSLSKVMVKPIPDEYVIPNGKIEIKDNGSYDVTDKATAKIGVPMPTGTLEITSNGNYNVKEKEFANVNVPEKQLGTKSITTNGTYKAIDDNLDGYSEVSIETSGVNINEYMSDTVLYSPWTEIPKWVTMILQLRNPIKYSRSDLSRLFMWYQGKKVPKLEISNITNTDNMFAYCVNLEEIELFDTSNVTYMGLMFYNCESLKTIPQFDTSKVYNMNMMFSGCGSLTSVPQLNTSKLQYVSGVFSSCSQLENLGGFLNLGQAYPIGISTNNYSYKLDLTSCKKLTHDSLMNVINGLYDIKTKGCNPQGLALGATNLAKLTSEEIAIATEKGWNVS